MAAPKPLKFAPRLPLPRWMNPRWLHSSRLLAAVLWLALQFLGPTAGAAESSAVDSIESRLRGAPDQALLAVETALAGSGGADRVELLVLRGWMQIALADGAAAEQTALELEQGAGDSPPGLAAAAAQLLRGRWIARRGPLGRADRMLGEAEARFAQQSTPGLRLRLLDARAKVKQGLGRLDEAVRLYQESVTLADRAGPPWRQSDQRSQLAYTLFLAQQVERAQEFNVQAVNLARAAGDKLALSGAMTTSGIIDGALGRKTEELQAMRDAITLAREAGATRDAVLGMANLSDFYLKQADYATALKLAREALPLARQVKDPMIESVALTNAGLALISLNRREEGMRLAQQALMLEERAGALTSMSQIQEELGLALEKNGHHREAWVALLEHRRLSDEVFQREQQQAVLEMQEASEAERRQREMAALQTEMGLKEAQLEGRDLQQQLWAFSVLAGTLLLAVVGLLVRRMRRSNAALTSSNAELEVASGRDPLTGLANRRQFQSLMHAQQASTNFEGTLLLIDVDHFKRINDQHGHAVGDAVLVEIAQRLRDTLRAEDLTVRWGGEEFLVLVQGLPAQQVEALAQRLLAAIGGRAVQPGRERVDVTASIGFATFPLLPQRQPLGWERAIDLVDTAMYLAKAHGRNRAYGVRSLAAVATAGTLEQAWRNGQADLTLLPGPGAQSVAAPSGAGAAA